jgi:hypothetical protein
MVVDLTFRDGALNNIDASGERDTSYESMSAAEIRKLCTRRSIKLPSSTKIGDRIVALRKYDSIAASYLEAMGREIPGGDGDRPPRRTRGCMLRLINLLFSDEFSGDFAATGMYMYDEFDFHPIDIFSACRGHAFARAA